MPINLSGLPNVPMRIITFVLFVMVSWACVGSTWLGVAYLLANYFVVLLGIWAERDNTSPISVQFFFFGMAFTILNDVISVGITFEVADYASDKIGGRTRSTFQFNAAMAIILLLGKPIACVFLYKEWQCRMGGGDNAGSQYETLGSGPPTGEYNQGSYNQGAYGGVNEKKDHPPQYQPPNQPFP